MQLVVLLVRQGILKFSRQKGVYEKNNFELSESKVDIKLPETVFWGVRGTNP